MNKEDRRKQQLREKHEENMREADQQMRDEAFGGDPSAGPQVFRADVGRGTFAHSEVPTASSKIVRHDRPYSQIRNRHPQLESDEVEALLEHVYGQGLYSALVNNFRSFDPGRLAEVLAMSEEEVEDLLYDEEDDEEEDDDYAA
jgi:hypothetical protein